MGIFLRTRGNYLKTQSQLCLCAFFHENLQYFRTQLLAPTVFQRLLEVFEKIQNKVLANKKVTGEQTTTAVRYQQIVSYKP